jgi:cell division protein FtsB
MAVLASIAIMLAVTLVPTLRSYLRQQGEIDAMRATVARQRAAVDGLREQKAQWADPAFVEQQARERLKFVKVGEKSYTVIDATPPAASGTDPKVASVPAASGRNHPWYGQLWQSMVIADTPAAATTGKLPLTTVTTPGQSTR